MSGRVVVIEDNPTNLELMTYLLECYGFQAVVATDGEAGVEAVLAEEPDLVLCDIQIPRLDGFGVLQKIRAVSSLDTVPVIAVTALAMVGDRERILDSGFDGYIAKPIDPETFLVDVERFSGRAATTPVPHEPVRTSAHDAGAAGKRGLTVLAIDDSPVNLEFLEAAIQGTGYRLVTASNAWEGLRKAEELRPALIVCDLHMPERDGYALLTEIKKHEALREIPFVMISSSSWTAEDATRAREAGAAQFVARPIEPDVLVRALTRLMG